MANSLDSTQDPVAAGRNLDRKYQNQNDLRGNYNIGTLEYPEGLRDKPDLQHYVAFFINVRDKTTNSTNTGANNSKKEVEMLCKELRVDYPKMRLTLQQKLLQIIQEKL